jgi:hypothetical protein
MNSPPYLDRITSFCPDSYRGISTTDLLVYVASEMEANGIRLTFESIAVAAYRFFPEAFALVGFPEYPDASRVGRTLLQCRPKYRGLIGGGASTGFVITELGRIRSREVAEQLRDGRQRTRSPRRGKPRAIVDRIEQELRESPAFASWRNDASVSEYDFYHLLHLLPGSSRESVKDNFAAISSIAKDSQDSKIRNFLAFLSNEFAKELR